MAVVICGFCGRELPEEIEQETCGRCAGGCRKIHCPHCGYENPAPSGLLKRLAEGKQKREKDKTS